MSAPQEPHHEPEHDVGRFSIEDIDADLEAIAREDKQFREGVIDKYKALRETVDAESIADDESPMRIYAIDSEIGAPVPLELAATSPDHMVQVSQETRRLKASYDELLEYLTQGWQPPENLSTSEYIKSPIKHVLDPNTSEPVGIHTQAKRKYYSLRDVEELGKPPVELVWDISFSFKARKDSERDGEPTNHPTYIGINENGYVANFPTANATLELNDPRNPRNWDSRRVEDFLKSQLIPLAHLPALETDETGIFPLRPDRGKPESEVDRLHGIAILAKSMIDENLEYKSWREDALKDAKSKLRVIITSRPGAFGDFIKNDKESQIDVEATLASLLDLYNSSRRKQKPGEPPVTLNEIAEAVKSKLVEAGAYNDEATQSIQDSAVELVMKINGYQNDLAHASEWIKNGLNRVESKYDEGFFY